MKRNEWMALIVTTFLMFAICLSASAKGKKTVERGMTKQEVMTILGQPKLTSFDAYGDRWDYFKINVLTGENKQITVGFDLNGRVVAYNMTTAQAVMASTTETTQPPTTVSTPSLHTEQGLMRRSFMAIVSTMLPSQSYIIR